MQCGPVRCLAPADLLDNVAVNALRFLPLQAVEGARDHVFRRFVERLCDLAILLRPIAGEDLVGPSSQEHVELTRDSLVNGLAQGLVYEWHRPASERESVRRIFLGATGALHDAVDGELRDRDDLSHVAPR